MTFKKNPKLMAIITAIQKTVAEYDIKDTDCSYIRIYIKLPDDNIMSHEVSFKA